MEGESFFSQQCELYKKKDKEVEEDVTPIIAAIQRYKTFITSGHRVDEPYTPEGSTDIDILVLKCGFTYESGKGFLMPSEKRKILAPASFVDAIEHLMKNRQQLYSPVGRPYVPKHCRLLFNEFYMEICASEEQVPFSTEKRLFIMNVFIKEPLLM